MYKKLYRYFLEREIANLDYYLSILEQTLNTKRQEVSTNIDLADDNLIDQNDELRKELINLKVETERLKGFSNLLRQSFLISLYSFMELWLIRECYLDSKRRDGGKSYISIKGRGIEKVKKYFSDIMQSSFPFVGSNQDWLWITNFKLLRDCIVHRQGSLTGFSDFKIDSNLNCFVQNESGLSLFGINNNQVFVEYEFCQKALRTVHRFLLEILSLNPETG